MSHAVKRKRLTFEQMQSIVEVAEPWFAAACRFALYCDQRRSDVATIETSSWNDGVLAFEAEKTGHVVRVKAGPQLSAAIADCLANGPKNVSSIIRRPGRREPVSADMLTQTFSSIRDNLISAKPRNPAWKDYRPASPGKPTWHELRSLGAHLAERAGKDAKSLAGHATDEMAAMYQKGHAKITKRNAPHLDSSRGG